MSGLAPEQLLMRAGGITATDISAIVGHNPYKRPIDVWLHKTGRAPAFEGNNKTRWGERLEAPVREEYAERHGVVVEMVGTVRHPKHRWWMATPDGIVYRPRSRSPERGLEIKVHDSAVVNFGAIEYGSSGSDEVPAHELIQCEWGMGATELDLWDLIVFITGTPDEYTIQRDDELIEMLSEQAQRFHIDHVLADAQPPADGSPSWNNWLRKRWDKHNEDFVRLVANDPRMKMVEQLERALAAEAIAQDAVETIKQRIKDEIGATSGFIYRDPTRPKPAKVSWRKSRDGERVDWPTSYSSLRGDAGLIASAVESEILQMATELRSAHPRAAELLETMLRALQAVAAHQKIMKPQLGSRRFLVPRFWKMRRDDKPEEDDGNTNTTED